MCWSGGRRVVCGVGVRCVRGKVRDMCGMCGMCGTRGMCCVVCVVSACGSVSLRDMCLCMFMHLLASVFVNVFEHVFVFHSRPVNTTSKTHAYSVF